MIKAFRHESSYSIDDDCTSHLLAVDFADGDKQAVLFKGEPNSTMFSCASAVSALRELADKIEFENQLRNRDA